MTQLRFLLEELALAKKPGRPQSVFQSLVKVAQSYARAFDSKDPPPPGTTTEVERLREQLEAADSALGDDVVELAQGIAADAKARREELAARVQALERERGDLERRRNEFAETAARVKYDWRIEHRQDRDSIGPFTIEHQPQSSVIRLGTCKLVSHSFPSGSELLEAVKAERQRLENAATNVWPEMKEKLLPLQTDAHSAVSWARVAAALGSEKVPFKKREAVVIFALAWLRVGGLEPGWKLSTRPPALSQQSKKESVVLPRIDRPGNPEKVSAIRLEPPAAA